MKRFLVLAALAVAPLVHAQNTAVLTWTAPTVDTGGSPIAGTLSYRIYQALRGQTKTVVATVAAPTHTVNAGLVSGREYCWAVSATQTLDGVESPESAQSVEACKRFPGGTPATPTTLEVR